jgi:hypothetical protein
MHAVGSYVQSEIYGVAAAGNTATTPNQCGQWLAKRSGQIVPNHPDYVEANDVKAKHPADNDRPTSF